MRICKKWNLKGTRSRSKKDRDQTEVKMCTKTWRRDSYFFCRSNSRKMGFQFSWTERAAGVAVDGSLYYDCSALHILWSSRLEGGFCPPKQLRTPNRFICADVRSSSGGEQKIERNKSRKKKTPFWLGWSTIEWDEIEEEDGALDWWLIQLLLLRIKTRFPIPWTDQIWWNVLIPHCCPSRFLRFLFFNRYKFCNLDSVIPNQLASWLIDWLAGQVMM